MGILVFKGEKSAQGISSFQDLCTSLAGRIGTGNIDRVAVDTFAKSFGSGFVAIALFFFAFTILMAYYYIAAVNLVYLNKKVFSKNRGNGAKIAINVLSIFILLAVINGCLKLHFRRYRSRRNGMA